MAGLDPDLAELEAFKVTPSAEVDPDLAELEAFKVEPARMAGDTEVPDLGGEELPAPAEKVAPTPAEPSVWDKVKYAASNPLEYAKSVGEAGQTAVEGLLSPLGVQAPVAAAEAAPNYVVGKVKDLLSGTDTSPSFGSYMDEARKEINKRAGKFEPTATVSRFAGDTAAGIATGGFGTVALGAKAAKLGGLIADAAPAIARVTSTAAKLLGPTVTQGVKAGIQLAVEGAVQGAEQAATTVIDKQIAQGDFKGLGEKLYSEMPAGALEGAKWNTIIGGATRLGLHGLSRGKTGTVEDLKFTNGAAETPDVADVYDPNLPLRSADIVDSGTPEAIAARQLTTPDVAKDVQLDALPDIEKDFKRMFAIEDNHAKSVVHSAENAFDDINVSNGVETDLQSKNVYHERLPLRGSELVDNATPDVIAARKAITPEQHKVQVDRAVKDVIKLENEAQEIAARADFVLRKNAKVQWAKNFDQPHTGDSFDDILAKNGLSDEMLEKLKRDTAGDGTGKIERIIRAIKAQRENLPNGGRPAVSQMQFQAPAPGTRVSGSALPAPSGNAVADFENAGGLVSALGKLKTRQTAPSQGQIFNALDQIKSVVQKTANGTKGGLVHEALLDPGKNLRYYLENPDYVPEQIARGQQAVNAKWSPDIQLQRNADSLYKDGAIGGEFVGGDEYHIVPVMDEGAASKLFSKLGSLDAAEQSEETFRAAGRQHVDSLQERTRWVETDDKTKADVRRLMELQFQKEQTLNKIVLLNRYAEQAALTPPVDGALSALKSGDRVNTQSLSGLLNGLGTVAADGTEEGLKAAMRRKEASLGAGPAKDEYRALRIKVENQLNRVGLANKYAAETAKNPPSVRGAVRQIGESALESLPGIGGAYKGAKDVRSAWQVRNNADSAKAALQIKSAVVKAQARMDKAARLQSIVERIANPVQRAGQAVDLEIVKKKVEDELKKIDERQENADKTLSQVGQLVDHGGEELGQAYAEHLEARDAFLLEKAGLAPRSTVFGTEKRELDPDTAETMARYLDAVDNPVGAIERMAAGEATVEQQEALSALYPSMLQEFRSSVIDQLATSKKKISYDEKETLASILGVGLTPDSDGASLAFYQGLASGEEEEQPKMGSRKFEGQDVASRGDSLLS